MSSAIPIYIVYETTNLINGKYYIGVHYLGAIKKDYLGSGITLKRSINKYGKENFIRETLREFSNEQDAYDFERSIVNINMVNNINCYNITLGGGNPPSNKGKVRSIETRKKLSDSHKGNKGYIHSKETKEKISTANKGHIHSKETKQKMSDSRKGKITSKETKQKISKAKQTHTYYINNLIFNSSTEAGKYFNISNCTIIRWCNSLKKPNCYRKSNLS